MVKEIRADVATGAQMNRLVQGDVGSGKTIVALLAMLLAIDNGFQAALMAPTEILATQHYQGLKALCEPAGITIELLTGSTNKSDRASIHQRLQSGELHILIGTHALIEPTVKFANLGLAVIDEQHRFGVAACQTVEEKRTSAACFGHDSHPYTKNPCPQPLWV